MNTEKYIDEIEALLEKAAKDLDARIKVLVSKLESRSGVLIGGELELNRAIMMRTEIAREMALYTMESEVAVQALEQAARDSAAHMKTLGIASEFTQSDVELVKAMQQNVRAEIASASISAQAGITEAIYVGVVTGRKQTDLLADITQLLIGQTDRRGNPMVNHAKTIFRTGYMEVDAVVQRKKAGDAGITKFKYIGGTVRDSRQWCIDHLDGVYTEDQIKAWEGQQWAGKKAGDPFVVRGGWSCMHQFRAYIEEV